MSGSAPGFLVVWWDFFSALCKHCVSGVQHSLLTECTTERVSVNLMILYN